MPSAISQWPHLEDRHERGLVERSELERHVLDTLGTMDKVMAVFRASPPSENPRPRLSPPWGSPLSFKL